jgi:hypothetical protein
LLDILPVLDRLDDGSIRAGSANILLFERLDECRFAIPRWRLREVLRRGQVVQVEFLFDAERRQKLILLFSTRR